MVPRRTADPWVVAALAVCIAITSEGQGIRAQQPHLRGTVDLRVGLVDGERPFLFGDVCGLELDGRGRLLVADRQADEVRVFAPGGRHLFTVGRGGDGPGELRAPCAITVDSAGNLWVVSVSRLDVFTLEDERGRHLRRLSVRGVTTGTPPMFVGADHIMVAAGASRAGRRRRWRVMLDPAGHEIRRVALPDPLPHESLLMRPATIPRPNGGTIEIFPPPPFGPVEVLAHAPHGGAAHMLTSRYVINLFDAEGQRSGQIERNLAGPRVSPQERLREERLLDSSRTGLRRTGGAYPRYTVPSVKPPVAGLWYDRDGRLWVELTPTYGDSTIRADVFGASGGLAFTAEWPQGVSLRLGAIRGQVALGVERDELGVERVVRIRFK